MKATTVGAAAGSTATARDSDIIALARTAVRTTEGRESSSKNHPNCGGAR